MRQCRETSCANRRCTLRGGLRSGETCKSEAFDIALKMSDANAQQHMLFVMQGYAALAERAEERRSLEGLAGQDVRLGDRDCGLFFPYCVDAVYECLPLGMADFTSGLWQLETYLESSSAKRDSPAFTTSAFISAVLSSGFCTTKTCGAAHVKST